ncbi:protein ADM2 [Pelodytes ibericus]
MRSWMAVSLCYISFLCIQQIPGILPLPSPNILLLPTPRGPPERAKNPTEKHLGNLPFTPSPSDVWTVVLTLQRKKRRARRSRPARLMRVGCVLGTCQVQHLNYRIWQLVGQYGKEDSPKELSSPHSYG